MPTNPVSILDSIGRDGTRTYVHGARNNGLPMMVATGQQIEVDVPANNDDMPFQFQMPGSAAQFPVTVSNAWAKQTDADMAAALANSAVLTLTPDGNLPTWNCNSRPFSLASPPALQDQVSVIVNAKSYTAVVLPPPVVEEVDDTAGSFVSLFQRTATGPSQGTAIPAANWCPGIVVRFPLKFVTAVTTPSPANIYELSGTPQGDRYFLDQLGLLPGQTLGPAILGIALTLETPVPNGAPIQSPVTPWTIARSNLTAQPRSNDAETLVESLTPAPPPNTAPYIAYSGDPHNPYELDAIRLLQMASITNSGGYFLRAQSAATATATTLVLTVALVPTLDPTHPGDPLFDEESAFLPAAANAILYSPVPNPYPYIVRFNGPQHLQIKPAAQPGCLLAGWTRLEPTPDSITAGPDHFGFGALSLVEYSATAANGDNFCTFDQSIPISSSDAPTGQPLPRSAAALAPEAAPDHHTGDTSILRLRPRTQATALTPSLIDPTLVTPTLVTPTQVTRYYRTTLKCFPKDGNPWARLTDPQASLIAIAPGLRVLYGSRVPLPPLPQSPVFNRRLYYTDALLRPSEWPGVRLALYPTGAPGSASLTLEIAYHVLQSNPDNVDTTLPANLDITLPDVTARLAQLKTLEIQLTGAGDQDVSVTLDADPLSAAAQIPIQDLIAAVKNWQTLEIANAQLPPGAPRPGPAVITYPYPLLDTPAAFPGYKPFQPTLTLLRTIDKRCPSCPGDLPDTPLGRAIQAEIVSAFSHIPLQATATPSQPDPNAPSLPAFLAVAAAFQTVIVNAQVAYLRDPANLHQLWLIPNHFFPTADTAGDWGFATPRPLDTQLGFQKFLAPTFSAMCSPTGADGCWSNDTGTINYSLAQTTLAEQDYDLLGRAAFRFLEQQTADLTLLTDPANAVSMRALLLTRQQIADTLAQFGAGPAWLVPLLADPTAAANLDAHAIDRVTRDAFRQNLSAFYSLSTIVQLPLKQPSPSDILLFEGTVTPAYVGLPDTQPKPVFSDVLIGRSPAGTLETKATLLYDLPASPNEVPGLASLQVSFTHVQIPLDPGDQGPPDFNQGRWLRLANPFDAGTWNAPPVPPTTADPHPVFRVQVADRTFPPKPILQSTLTTPGTPTPTIKLADVPSLTAWGWQTTFGLVDPDDNDQLTMEVFYTPLPPPPPTASSSLVPQAWTPNSLLSALYVITALQANWLTIPAIPAAPPAPAVALRPLDALAQLAAYLLPWLSQNNAPPAALLPAPPPPPSDTFLVTYHAPKTPPVATFTVAAIGNPTAGQPLYTPPVPPLQGTIGATITAPPGGLNQLSLTGASALRSCRVGLTITRNSQFNPALLYRRARVDSPIDVFALNSFAALQFDMSADPTNLAGALSDFFQKLLSDSILSPTTTVPANLAVEVGTSLVWTRSALEIVTPFSIMPADLIAGAFPSATAIAQQVTKVCQQLLGTPPTAPPEADSAFIRLRIKLTEALPTTDPPTYTPRTLLEIAALDFKLQTHP